MIFKLEISYWLVSPTNTAQTWQRWEFKLPRFSSLSLLFLFAAGAHRVAVRRGVGVLLFAFLCVLQNHSQSTSLLTCSWNKSTSHWNSFLFVLKAALLHGELVVSIKEDLQTCISLGKKCRWSLGKWCCLAVTGRKDKPSTSEKMSPSVAVLLHILELSRSLLAGSTPSSMSTLMAYALSIVWILHLHVQG